MTSRTTSPVGQLGRLGGWTADHVRAVSLAWVVVAIGFGISESRVGTRWLARAEPAQGDLRA
ncbi:MAG: hypothetical protein WCH31_10065 [Actinomycetes bacterium]